MIEPLPRHIVPLPTPRRVFAHVRSRVNRFYVRYRLETPSSSDGSGESGPDGREQDVNGA
jgi:quinol---cytochrome-c reductase cytochrome b subunit